MINIYFQFKSEFKKYSGEAVLLSDLVDLMCPQPYIEQLNKIAVFPKGINGTAKVTAIEIISLIASRIDDVSISLIGSPFALIEPAKAKRDTPAAKIFSLLKVLVGIVLLFIGSLLAVLYFHADVNMNMAHRIIYRLISGETSERPMLMIIPYSIGVGVGIAIFFDVFNIKNKRQKPGPLELELFQAEQDMKDYLTNLKDKESN